MSSSEAAPAAPAPGVDRAPDGRPASIGRVIWLVRGLVAAGAVVTVLVVVFWDQLVAAWSAGHPPGSAIQQPVFVPVVIVSYLTIGGLLLTLLPFLRGGHDWARWSLVATIGLIVLATVGGLRTSPPTVFVLCGAVSLVYNAVILFSLLRPDTHRFLRGTGSSTAV
ncbi:hypothetical protein [Nocardioides nanhaiensis]|uniref:Integral membrane protein n=1 Tax=Nocardioides nanhaiensis TaxID=1476871 RepID=A0ABP8WV15_9ACTN